MRQKEKQLNAIDKRIMKLVGKTAAAAAGLAPGRKKRGKRGGGTPGGRIRTVADAADTGPSNPTQLEQNGTDLQPSAATPGSGQNGQSTGSTQRRARKATRLHDADARTVDSDAETVSSDSDPEDSYRKEVSAAEMFYVFIRLRRLNIANMCLTLRVGTVKRYVLRLH